MRKDYEKLFTYLDSPEPPRDLFEKIISRLEKEQKLIILKRRLAVFSLGFVGSAMAFIPALKMVRASFVESEFMYFFSLLFSDAEIVATYWQNFTLSLLERLPVTNIIIFFAVIFFFLGSLRLLMKEIKNIPIFIHQLIHL